MKTFNKMAAQGDLLIRKIDHLPDGLKEIKPQNQQLVVAHSETGHHHAIEATNAVQLFGSSDPMISYLKTTQPVELKHHRSFDTHETLQIPEGIFELRRQREWSPEGWRRVED